MDINLRLGEHVIALGKTGSGKTYLIKNAILRQSRRVLVVDSENMEFSEYALAKGAPERIVKAIPPPNKQNYRWRISPSTNNIDEYINTLCKSFIEAPDTQDSMIVFEEISDYSDAHYIPEYMRGLIRKARKRNITVIATSQRSAGINKWLWDNTSHKFMFYTDEDDIIRMSRLSPFTSSFLSDIKYNTHDYVYAGPDGVPHIMQHI